jgi:hypothetical protein
MQKELTACETKRLANALSTELLADPATKVFALSYAQPLAGLWLSKVPFMYGKNYIANSAFSAMLALRLTIFMEHIRPDLFGNGHCIYCEKNNITNFTYHAIGCEKLATLRRVRHDMVCNALVEVLRACRYSTRLEPKINNRAPHRGATGGAATIAGTGGDTLLPNIRGDIAAYDGGAVSMYIDCTICMPDTHATTTGSGAARGERAKRNHYTQSYTNMGGTIPIVAFALEPWGVFGSEAIRLLRGLVERQVSIVDVNHPVNMACFSDFAGRISTAIAAGTGRSLATVVTYTKQRFGEAQRASGAGGAAGVAAAASGTVPLQSSTNFSIVNAPTQQLAVVTPAALQAPAEGSVGLPVNPEMAVGNAMTGNTATTLANVQPITTNLTVAGMQGGVTGQARNRTTSDIDEGKVGEDVDLDALLMDLDSALHDSARPPGGGVLHAVSQSSLDVVTNSTPPTGSSEQGEMSFRDLFDSAFSAPFEGSQGLSPFADSWPGGSGSDVVPIRNIGSDTGDHATGAEGTPDDVALGDAGGEGVFIPASSHLQPFVHIQTPSFEEDPLGPPSRPPSSFAI